MNSTILLLVTALGAIKLALRCFNQWAINGGDLELVVYGGSCGLLVMVVTWPWSY